jgi:hypothetical protein
MDFFYDAFFSMGTVSLVIATGGAPLLALGTIECPDRFHHHDDPPAEKTDDPIPVTVKGEIREEENFIFFTLKEPINGFPINSKFAVNVDYIIAIGPVPILDGN